MAIELIPGVSIVDVFAFVFIAILWYTETPRTQWTHATYGLAALGVALNTLGSAAGLTSISLLGITLFAIAIVSFIIAYVSRRARRSAIAA